MSVFRRRLALLSAIALAAMVLGCDSDNPVVQFAPAQVRVAHLSPGAPAVDVWVDGERVLSGVPYPTIGGYLSVPAGSRLVQVTQAGTTTPFLINERYDLGSDVSYTVAATGLVGTSFGPTVLVDDRAAPAAGMARIRFVHASPDAPPVDIAVTGGPVLFSNVAFRGNDTVTVAAGTYDLEVRVAGTPTVVLMLPGVAFGSASATSVFAIGEVGAGTLGVQVASDL
ncbi:MAG: DUF4397 domain-containing protein [Acidobacteriota bacterium]